MQDPCVQESLSFATSRRKNNRRFAWHAQARDDQKIASRYWGVVSGLCGAMQRRTTRCSLAPQRPILVRLEQRRTGDQRRLPHRAVRPPAGTTHQCHPLTAASHIVISRFLPLYPLTEGIKDLA